MTERKKQDEGKCEGVAEGILKGIGKMVPGLGRLIESLERSPAFKERLRKIDEEVERKLGEGPSHIPMGMPPGARGRAAGGKPFVKVGPGTTRAEAPAPKEPPADVFDEEDCIKVIAEMPGVEEDDISIDLREDNLVLSVDIPGRRYRHELRLPCKPKGGLKKTYKNGILEVTMRKK